MRYDTSLLEKLKSEFPDDVLNMEATGPMPHALIKAASLKRIVGHIRDDKGFNMKYLNCITAVHVTDEHEGKFRSLGFNLIYNFTDADFSRSISLKVYIEDHGDGSINNVVPSIDIYYKSANWFEREIYDLMGIFFHYSKDLSRILLPPDWVGHPLRKDYSEQPSYNDMPTGRSDELQSLRLV